MDTETFAFAQAAAEPVAKRETRAIAWTAAVLLVLALLAVVAWQTHILRPGLDLGSGAEASADGSRVTIRAEVRNAGWLDEQLAGFTANAPWVEVVSAHMEPEVIPPGSSGTLVVELDVTCGGSFTVPSPGATLSTLRPWGEVSAPVDDSWGLFTTQPIEFACGG